MNDKQIGYYAIIPATVLFNEKLKANEKLLYALITVLSNKEGYRYASNRYMGEKFGVNQQTISNWLGDLKSFNLIYVEIIRNDKKEIIQRRIYLKCTPYISNDLYPYRSNSIEGIDQKMKDNIISNNNITEKKKGEKINKKQTSNFKQREYPENFLDTLYLVEQSKDSEEIDFDI